MKVYIETYGCALNKADEAIMREVLSSRGHILVDSPELADALVLNTCIVRKSTEEHVLKRLREFRELGGNGKKLIVAGCMAKAMPYTVVKIAPEASLVSPQNAHLIYIPVEAKERKVLLEGARPRNKLPTLFQGRIAPIPIQEGCLGNCSFCITKHARRVLVSHSIEAVVAAVKKAVEQGAVEVELTGMDLGTYGIDLYKRRALPQLLKNVVEKVKGNYMIRIGMINPEHLAEILDDFIDAIVSSGRIYKFVHIPLQSGSDQVLKVMGRRYDVETIKALVRELKNKIPGVSIATDIIIGHPGETDEDFEQTLRVLRELEFERVHVAAYSIRQLTTSPRLPPVSSRVVKQRMLAVMKTVEEVGLKVREKYIGAEVECFVTEFNKRWVCRLDNYIPVVIACEEPEIGFGDWVRVKVEEATFFDLRGKLLGVVSRDRV